MRTCVCVCISVAHFIYCMCMLRVAGVVVAAVVRGFVGVTMVSLPAQLRLGNVTYSDGDGDNNGANCSDANDIQ